MAHCINACYAAHFEAMKYASFYVIENTDVPTLIWLSLQCDKTI